MNNDIYRYFFLGSTVAIARITVSQLGVVFPRTMGPPAIAFSWLILILIGFMALIGLISIWREAQGKLSASDFIGVAGVIAGAIALNLVLQGIGVWLAV